ncbi:aluminum-activated malate transporter 12-like protein [Cinnamomum micranthum f. kanehirae]|uniref:Aluminum-activated malate transporter 12-like protein n=1 Tax=Cinnamomum micranthum f. kanehirae TaxID=337451 RepID=A0A3S3N334_9MAGN|nr:aluminum-activated malate transporter 12-like protein [Cinnamomum micranthum f. kanehirae]
MAESEARGNGINMSSNGHVWKTMGKMRRLLESVWHKILAVGREDPRQVIHSLKVGVALALVSLLYLLEPLFDGVGANVIWAVMTVVLVLEYTAGKGLGTLLTGSLTFLIEYIADESGRVFHAVFIGISVFIIGSTSLFSYMLFMFCSY